MDGNNTKISSYDNKNDFGFILTLSTVVKFISGNTPLIIRLSFHCDHIMTCTFRKSRTSFPYIFKPFPFSGAYCNNW